MKAEQECGSHLSQWRLKHFILWDLVSYQANTTSQPNSYSCVSAFQPFIFSADPSYFLPCHSSQSCAHIPVFSVASFCLISDDFSFLRSWQISHRQRRKKVPFLISLCLLSSIVFFTFLAPYLSLSLSACLLCSIYASQQSRFPFLRL